MTANWHTPIPYHSPATAAILNAPLAELDAALGSASSFVNALDYATGNGSTDDTTALHAARDVAIAGGRVLYLPTPPSAYLVDELTLYTCDVVADPGAIIKLKAGANHALILLGGTHWRGGRVNGNRGAVPSGYGVGIFGNNVTFERATVHDCQGPAIQMGGGTAHIIKSNLIYDTVGGVWLAPVGSDVNNTGALIEGNTIDLTSEALGYYDGIGVHPDGYAVFGTRIVNNFIYMLNAPAHDGPIAIELFTTDGPIDQASVEGNYCVGGGIGISTSGSLGTFTGNSVIGAGDYAIESLGGYNTFVGNTIDGAQFGTTTPQTLRGFILGDSTTGHVLSGNIIRRCTTMGIDLEANHCAINANVIQQASGDCLFIGDGAGSSITGNVPIPSGSAFAYESDTPGAGIVFRGNVGIADAG